MSTRPKKKLGSLVRFIGGGTPDRENPVYWKGTIPWASVKDLGNADLSNTMESISAEGLKNSACNLLPAGTVVIASRVGLGKVSITTREIAINQDLKGLIPLSEEIRPRYLFYYFSAIAEQIVRAGVGATVLGVTIEYLQGLEIPLPPKNEQDRIVQLLDEAAALRHLRTQADERTAVAAPALFDEMFGDPATNPKNWPLVRAGELMACCDYGTSTRASDQGQGIPMLRMNNVTEYGILALEDIKTVELKPTEIEKYRLKQGDVLFNRTNSRELVGKTGMWKGQFEAVAASYFIRVRFDSEREHPQHFTSFMNLPFMKQRLHGMAKGAIGQANINAQELKGIEIPLPPITLQRTFAARVAEIRVLEAEQITSRKRIDDLFQSLLHRAFQGEL